MCRRIQRKQSKWRSSNESLFWRIASRIPAVASPERNCCAKVAAGSRAVGYESSGPRRAAKCRSVGCLNWMLEQFGREPALLDVINIPLEGLVPLPDQPENWLMVRRAPWRNKGTMPPEDLPRLLDFPLKLWGTQKRSVDAGHVDTMGEPASLYFVESEVVEPVRVGPKIPLIIAADISIVIAGGSPFGTAVRSIIHRNRSCAAGGIVTRTCRGAALQSSRSRFPSVDRFI